MDDAITTAITATKEYVIKVTGKERDRGTHPQRQTHITQTAHDETDTHTYHTSPPWC
jgi:hypothetical protein